MATPEPLRHEWPLVGRHDEQQLVLDAFAAGRPVVVSGTGGVGKTRLLRAAAAEARADGWEVRNAVGSATASGIPLGAVAHLVPSGALDSGRDEVLRAIVLALEESTARAGRLLLCVDDCHFVDDASALLVAHLARGTSPTFAVALTVRAGEVVPDAIGGVVTDDLTERIDLAPLDEEQTGQLLQEGLGAEVDPVTVRLLARWTRGNVLFLRELVRDGLAREVLRLEHGIWRWHGPPEVGPTLRELIGARHRQLAGPVLEALEVVAIGEPLPVATLASLVDEAGVAALDEAGLLQWDHDHGAPVVRISHPLHGEALRRSTSQARANRVRRQLADALGELEDADAPGDPGDRLRRAVLLADAGVPTDPDALVAAARRAWALRDTALVERLARAALRSGPNPDAEYLLGETLADHGEYEAALDAWLEILAGDPPEPLRVAVAVAAAAVLALTLHREDEARELLDRVEAGVASTDGRARLDGSRSALFLPTDGPATDPPASDEPDQARIFAWLGSARARLLDGATASVLAEADDITAVARRAGEEFPMAAMFVGICRFFALVQSGRLDDARTFSEAEQEASLLDPLPIAPATWSQGLGIVALARGHLAEAATHLRAAAALLRGNDIGNLRHVLHELALSQAVAGDAAGVASALAEATTANSGLIEPFVEDVRIDAALLAAQGDVSGARRLLLDALAGRSARTAFYDVPAWHDLARYGAPEDAARELAGWVERADGPLVGWYLDQARALAGADPDALEDVATTFEEHGYDLDAAESLAAASAAAHRGGEERRATALDRRVDDLLGRCGPETPRTPLLAARGELQALSAREREVAALAADGLSDNEVAERLVLSPRTVHAHLRSIYRKLGVSGRSELAQRWHPGGD